MGCLQLTSMGRYHHVVGFEPFKCENRARVVFGGPENPIFAPALGCEEPAAGLAGRKFFKGNEIQDKMSATNPTGEHLFLKVGNLEVET